MAATPVPHRLKDGTIHWRQPFRLVPGGRVTHETFDTRETAEQFGRLVDKIGGAKAREVRTASTSSAADVPTVAEQVVRHINALSGSEPGTIKQYRSYAAELAGTALGAMPIDMATRDDVAAWIRDMDSAAKTIKNKQSLVSAALARAVDDEQLSRNVAHKHKIPRTETEEMTFLTPDEFMIILNRARVRGPNPCHYWPFLITLFGTGMRFSEATALRVSDVHLKARTPSITVTRAWKRPGEGKPARIGPTKTDRGKRTISLPPEVIEALRPVIAGRKGSELVFTTTQGLRLQERALYKRWVTWIADERYDGRRHVWVPVEPALGKRPSIHALRHSHASWMLARGCTLFRLQYRLGHESIKTTSDRYSHQQPDAGRLDAIDAAWDVPDEPGPLQIGA
jgi:integrase